ncbi:MAG TPA: hypothetical protein VHS97_25415 [Isosphaeraceae bacterium]|nr:hypothetical protein [Isosphaeraceae bacterium]
MPDPIELLKAMSMAAAVAAAMLGIFGWPRRKEQPTWIDDGWVLGVTAGFILGCWAIGIRPHWPPREDLDRLLALVIPAVLAVELVAAFPKVPRWLIWPLRMVIVAWGTRVLLHGSGYITDLAGPATSEWSPAQTWTILSGVAAIEAAVWVCLALLARRAPGSSVPLSLAIVIAGSAVTVMLSGYSTGGQVGLPLAAALLGSTVAAAVLPRSSPKTAQLGVPIVGLFSLLVIGRFFGQLTTAHAILLVLAPLLAWIPELIYPRRLPPWARGLLRLVLVGSLVAAVLVHAQSKFNHDFQSPSGSGSKEPSLEDYMNFGK